MTPTQQLVTALLSYQRLLTYLRRTTNNEEWATHGDWAKLERDGNLALEAYTAECAGRKST